MPHNNHIEPTVGKRGLPSGWIALRWSGELTHLFLAQSLGLVATGLINWPPLPAAPGSGR
jgi:hypothetical protein